MAQNRFLNSCETVWGTVQLAATTVAARRAMACLKYFVTREFDMKEGLPITRVDHPMNRYGRFPLETCRNRLFNTVRSLLLPADTSDDVQALLRALFTEEDSEAFGMLTQALRRYREWRTVVATGSEMDEDETEEDDSDSD